MPVPTMETMIFPSVWIVEAVPVDEEDSSRGISEAEFLNSVPMEFCQSLVLYLLGFLLLLVVEIW